MDIGQQQIQEAVPSAFESVLQKAKSNSKSFQQPTPRIFHSCVCHRAYIFIYGGLSLNPSQQFQNEHLFVYRYEIHRFEWKKIQTNFPNNLGGLNPLQNIYSHSCVVHGNVMYLFGGKSGKNGQCNNELWAMNLQSFNWRKQQQKGVIPARRQSASFVLANKSNLLLYGGKNEDFIFNDINIYKTQSKQWYNVETNNCEYLIPKRLRPGICVVNDIIYVFGGERESSIEQKTQILSDFYQIKIVQKATSVRPDVWIKKISTLLNPGQLAGVKLLNINDRYVGLLGGNSFGQIQSKNKLWMYDPQKVKWIYSNIQDPNKFSLGLGFNSIFQYDRVYISGGLKSDFTPLGSLYSIHIDPNDIPVNQFQSSENERLCLLCQQQKQSLCRKKLNGFTLFEQTLKEMRYPFNAFGLLVDNSNLLKSGLINIECCHAGKQRFLLISDDGNCQNVWTNEDEFIEDMLKFRTISQQQMQLEGDETQENQTQNIDQGNMEIQDAQKDKKRLQEPGKQQAVLGSAKKEEDKEQEKKLKKKKELAKKNKARKLRRRKEFSINVKIGAMRLAKKMIYITETPDGSKRVFFMEELKIVSLDQQQPTSGQLRYQCHYYLIPSTSASTPVHSHHSSQTSRQYIESEYKNYLKVIQQGSSFKNYLFLIGLKDILTEDNIREPELKINTKMNDIYFGTNKLISKAEALNMIIPDCVDISLKCYLSMLYLKGQYAKITLSTQSQKSQQVSNALYFEKIDNLVKSNAIMDLEAAFDLQQCKIVELYYHKNLLQTGKKNSKSDKKQKSGSSKDLNNSNNLGVFLNGILIYHRNRLIKRYEYSLGSLIKYNDLKKVVGKNYNPLKIFGFIELDQVFYTNIFKTNFVNQQHLHNMEARIKFVEHYLENKSQQAPIQLSAKRSHKKIEGQAGDQQIQSKKKIKGVQ